MSQHTVIVSIEASSSCLEVVFGYIEIRFLVKVGVTFNNVMVPLDIGGEKRGLIFTLLSFYYYFISFEKK